MTAGSLGQSSRVVAEKRTEGTQYTQNKVVYSGTRSGRISALFGAIRGCNCARKMMAIGALAGLPFSYVDKQEMTEMNAAGGWAVKKSPGV